MVQEFLQSAQAPVSIVSLGSLFFEYSYLFSMGNFRDLLRFHQVELPR